MNLAIDIGNTLVKVGVFDGEKLVEQQSFESLDLSEFVRQTRYDICHVIVSSVRDVLFDAGDLEMGGIIMHLDTHSQLPITSLYKTPETLGKDRIAAVVGAHYSFPNNDVLVIDAGTCITYDLVTQEGVHIGGNISPGLEMRYEAMHHFTAQLPSVSRKEAGELFGRSTEEALQNGGLMGIMMEIEGYLDICRKKFSSMVPVLTGGDAEYFAEKQKTKIFVCPNLVLIGLNEILMLNVT